MSWHINVKCQMANVKCRLAHRLYADFHFFCIALLERYLVFALYILYIAFSLHCIVVAVKILCIALVWLVVGRGIRIELKYIEM